MICHNKSKMNTGALGLYFILTIAFSGADDREAKLRFYIDSFDNFIEYPINEAHKIFQTTWYKSNRCTMIFCPGFTGIPTGPAVTGVVSTYLEQGECNVALLNWEYLASATLPSFANSYSHWAAPNARQLGVRLADTLIKMSEAGFRLNGTRLIGHSLGAHIWGIAGNNMLLKGIQLPWITGLDPAAIGFERKSAAQRLNPGSARFVDVMHTDSNKYGTRIPSGTVDFWPNFRIIGPVKQPGCPNHPAPVFSSDDLCGHNRSWQLLIDALKYPGSVIGSYARNYKIWKNYSMAERRAITLQVGKYEKNVQPGNYYFLTNSQSPYGLGMEGL